MALELKRRGHARHCTQVLSGLPAREVGADGARAALAFYCVGALDVLGALPAVPDSKREEWRGEIWRLQVPEGGFKGSAHMTIDPAIGVLDPALDPPHLIMSYTALLTLAILRDDFSALDRAGLGRLLRACQQPDGGFASTPGGADADLRLLYCALALAHMLGASAGAVDVPAAVRYVRRCRTYEGGYGQQPGGEAIGGTTYCALAALAFAGVQPSPAERAQTARWLALHQDGEVGGFAGRTGKPPDACYSFWCGAALAILGEEGMLHAGAQAQFLAACQGQFGGLAKAPDESPDPYHTYMALAALALAPPPAGGMFDASWALAPLDPLLNATRETAAWARAHVPGAG